MTFAPVRRSGALILVAFLALALGACGEDPPLPAEDILAGMEAGYGKQAVLNSLPEGPGVESEGGQIHGYRHDRYFLGGRSVEILWLREDGAEALEALDRSQANPVIFVDQVLDGWGWDHFDERQVDWNMIDRTDPPPPAEAPALEHDDSPAAVERDAPARDAFFVNLASQCGEAFPGGLAIAPPGDDMLEGDELLVVHFRECEDEELRIPFHIEQMDGEWNRSRTWIIRKVDDRLELRHDHREPDGTESEVTQYGGFTATPGSANRQEFLYDEEDADGSVRGWRIIIEPGVEYIYGTIRDGEWTWRVDFDLSEPLDTPPPAPWGH